MEPVNISGISDDDKITGKILSKEEAKKRRYFLKGKTIGISISESDNLKELGLGVMHLRDAMTETARYILAAGGNVSYGGDMRPGGFTELMFDLLKHYKNEEDMPSKRFINYLAWPLSLNLSLATEASLTDKVTFKRITPPDDIQVQKPDEFLPPTTPENLFTWAKCLSKMRNEMESSCHARIFIGGKATGFKGKCPGILEELMIAIEKNHPVYLVGAFGGITQDCLKAIEGQEANNLSEAFQTAQKDYADFFASYNDKEKNNKIDYAHYYSVLSKTGFDGLQKLNGLSVKDNKRLAVTPHLQEIVYLILKGLNKIS